MAMLSGASEIGKLESVIRDLWFSIVPNLDGRQGRGISM